jgi:hypothetical protein
MDRKKYNEGDENNLLANSVRRRSDSLTRRNMERQQRLENAGINLRSEYEQYKMKAKKHGETFSQFNKSYGKLDQMLNMPGDQELRQPINDYINRENRSNLARYEIWDESTINDKFRELRQKINYVEKEELEKYIGYGKTLKELREELVDFDKKIRDHNMSIKDHNAHSPHQLDTIDIEHWNEISDNAFMEKTLETS